MFGLAGLGGALIPVREVNNRVAREKEALQGKQTVGPDLHFLSTTRRVNRIGIASNTIKLHSNKHLLPTQIFS